VVGGDRKIRQRQALAGFEFLLHERARDIAVEQGDQGVGRVADLADVQVVEVRIEKRAGGNRRTAEHADLAARVRPACDVLHCAALDVHAADKDRVCPIDLSIFRGADVLIDEADIPALRQIGGDEENTLRRHEGFDPHQAIRVLERAEGGRVAREHAQNSSRILYDCLASHGRPPGNEVS